MAVTNLRRGKKNNLLRLALLMLGAMSISTLALWSTVHRGTVESVTTEANPTNAPPLVDVPLPTTSPPSAPGGRLSGETELFFDENCARIRRSDAMTMQEIRFSLQRAQRNIFSVEIFTERDALASNGRKQTIERSQYIPDDVVVLDPSGFEPLVSFVHNQVMFDGDDAPTFSCSTEGLAFKFGQMEAQVSYEHIGKVDEMHPADLGAPNRARLARMGRVHDFHEGAARVTLTIRDAVDFYGLANRGSGIRIPEGADIRAKNLDINHYRLSPDTTLYGYVPFIYAVSRRTGETCGLFVLNGSPMRIRTTGQWNSFTAVFDTTDGGVRYFVFRGPTPADVLRQYYEVTGRPQLPPLFAIGFHQSRWSYRNEADVLQVSKSFEAASLPVDVLWLDIDHTNGKRYFTWDSRLFPNPVAMQDSLKKSGRRLVTITDPHIKRDESYQVFAEAHKAGYFVADEQGASEFVGECWPGPSSWIDFINPEARHWYSSLFSFEKYKGSTDRLFSWIDMNEPSVFSGPDLTMPMNARHVNNIPHRQVHNLYGFYHAWATNVGLSERSKSDQRPFVLSRSFFAGSQRYTAVWTGDNQATWQHLQASVQMVLSLSLSGIPFAGADVGGFFGRPEDELLVRWFQLGCLYPFFRQHSDDHSDRREPYLHSPAVRVHTSAALVFRYQLLPYLYTCFAEAAGVIGKAGTSIWRHLILQFPEDRLAAEVSDTFMIGDALLARPIVEPVGEVGGRSQYSIFVPRRSPLTYPIDRRSSVLNVPLKWYSFCSGLFIQRDGQEGPGVADMTTGRIGLMEETACPTVLFQRAGTIVPFKTSVGPSSEQLADHPLEIRVAVDDDNYAFGVLYLDDGVSHDYSTNDARCVVVFEFDKNRLCANTKTSDCPRFSSKERVQSIRFSNETLPPWKEAIAKKTLSSRDANAGYLRADPPRVIERSAASSFVTVTGLNLGLSPVVGAKSVPAEQPTDSIWCVQFR